MVSRDTRRTAGPDTTPGALPKTTPGEYAQPGHDFTLQAVMEMKGSLHELIAEVRIMSADLKSTREKVDGLRLRFAIVTGGAVVIGFIFATVLAVLRFAPASWFGGQ